MEKSINHDCEMSRILTDKMNPDGGSIFGKLFLILKKGGQKITFLKINLSTIFKHRMLYQIQT